MSKMVGVLMQACHSIGLTQIEGDGGNSLLQILDCDPSDAYRMSKRPRMIENAPISPLDKSSGALDGFKFQVGIFLCKCFLLSSHRLLSLPAHCFAELYHLCECVLPVACSSQMNDMNSIAVFNLAYDSECLGCAQFTSLGLDCKRASGSTYCKAFVSIRKSRQVSIHQSDREDSKFEQTYLGRHN